MLVALLLVYYSVFCSKQIALKFQFETGIIMHLLVSPSLVQSVGGRAGLWENGALVVIHMLQPKRLVLSELCILLGEFCDWARFCDTPLCTLRIIRPHTNSSVNNHMVF
jgi:hypothetical protein